jgi:hypothetical protein
MRAVVGRVGEPLEMVAAGDAVWVLEGLGLDVVVRLATS